MQYVKCLTGIKETTIDRRTIMHIPGDRVPYEPSAEGGRQPLLKSKLEIRSGKL